MPRLSVGILACNSEADIADCLASVAWADERIVILDTRSSDSTAEIASQAGAQVVPHAFEDFARQREFGLSLARGEWLFYVDSDERATPGLAQEVRQVIEDDLRVGWWVPRRNVIWGREIRRGGWHPDYQLRLLKLGRAHYDMTRKVHEIVELDGEEGYLREPLIHYNYRSVDEFVAKQRGYIGFEASILHEDGKRPRVWTYFMQPLREFWRRYVSMEGYKDGWHGLVLCLLVAYYYGFLVTVRLGRLWRAGDK